MIAKTSKIIAATLIAGATLFGVTACGTNTSGTKPSAETTAPAPEETETPMVETVDYKISELNGGSIDLQVYSPDKPGESTIAILTSDDPTAWTGVISPETLAIFNNAGLYEGGTLEDGTPYEGGAYDAYIQSGTEVGSGTVTLTNNKTGEVVTFTLNIFE